MRRFAVLLFPVALGVLLLLAERRGRRLKLYESVA